MAGETLTLKKLEEHVEEHLNCSICLDTYTEPKMLQCFHVYCQRCLVPLIVRDQQGTLGLACPTCRQVTSIPDRGVAGLQSAFHINRLLEIQDYVKQLQNPASPLQAPAENTTIDRRPRKDPELQCPEHAGEEFKLYCETCGELVCLQCVLKDGKHHDHDCSPLQKALESYKEEITTLLQPMERRITTISSLVAELSQCRMRISTQQVGIEENVCTTFTQLHEILKIREVEVIRQLHQTAQSKLKILASQSDRTETTLAQYSGCLHFMKESLKTDNEDDTHVLMAKTNTINKAKKLCAPFEADFLKPDTEADMLFLASAEMMKEYQDYGQIIATGSPNPSKCRHITSHGVDAVVIDESYTAIVQVVNYASKPCVEHVRELECDLVSDVAGTKSSCHIRKIRHSQYEIAYQPAVKGRHQLYIRVNGHNIGDSPSSLAVKAPIETTGRHILTISGMEGPSRVAINQGGEVVVTEWGGDCVSVFSPGGKKVRSFGTRSGRTKNPSGVAVDGDGNILVADCLNRRIQKFTSEGEFVASRDTKGSGSVHYTFSIDIAINPTNTKVYVVDPLNHRVQILNSDLTFSGTFGKAGFGKGLFSSPYGIACDSTGKVYVADTRNHRIQVFTAEGKFLRMFGKHGQGERELDAPNGVAVDTSGNVYVSEGGNDRISVFSSAGQFVTSFGRKGAMAGEFNGPYGLAVDDNGVLYVCDLDNNRVQVF